MSAVRLFAGCNGSLNGWYGCREGVVGRYHKEGQAQSTLAEQSMLPTSNKPSDAFLTPVPHPCQTSPRKTLRFFWDFFLGSDIRTLSWNAFYLLSSVYSVIETMSIHSSHSSGGIWQVLRPSISRHKVLVFSGLLLLVIAVFGSVRLIADETIRLEQRRHFRRQFQLGGVLGSVFRDVRMQSTLRLCLHDIANLSVQVSDGMEIKIKDASKSSVTISSPSLTTQDHTTSNTLSSLSDGSTSSPTEIPSTTALVESIQAEHQQNSDPQILLQTLTEAVKTLVEVSDPLISDSIKTTDGNQLSSNLVDRSRAVISTGSTSSQPAALTLSTVFKPAVSEFLFQTDANESDTASDMETGFPVKTSSPPTPTSQATGVLGDLSSFNLDLKTIFARQDARSGEVTSSTNGTSLLSCLSNLVAQVYEVDRAAAARLIDAVLEVLHVDPAAVASIIPQVARQMSVNSTEMLPYIIPAVANALGEDLNQSPPAKPSNMADALENIIHQGTIIIKPLAVGMGPNLDPSLQRVLSQVATIISAAASRLNKPICAISQPAGGLTYQIIVPCDSIDMAASNPTNSAGIEQQNTNTPSFSWSISTLASPTVYLEFPANPLTQVTPLPTANSKGPNQLQLQGPGYPGQTIALELKSYVPGSSEQLVPSYLTASVEASCIQPGATMPLGKSTVGFG